MRRLTLSLTHWLKPAAPLLVLLGFCGTLWGQPPENRWERFAHVVAAHARHSDALLEQPDVVGVGVGVNAQGEPVLKVFTKKNRHDAIPKKLDGADVEAVTTGEFFALAPSATGSIKPAVARPSVDKPPTVKFVKPQYGETLLGTVALTVNATDDKGVARVEFYYQQYDAYYGGQGRIWLGTDNSGSDGWSYNWVTSDYKDDRYILWADAYDTKNQMASHNVTILVDNVAGEPPAYSPDRPDDVPVAPIGVSVGNQYEASAGTTGCRVKDRDGNLYILSNNHVLALENTAPLGSWILQPGLYDTGSDIPYAWQIVGTLTTFVPITFSRFANNKVDAAVARINFWADGETPLVGVSTPGDGYGPPSSDYLTNSELSALFAGSSNKIPVQKYGRTTGFTQGTITSINTTVIVGYARGSARFVNQIVVESSNAFILPGDSGSLLVTQDGNLPAGLLFAGNSSGTYALANRIEDVLTVLGNRLRSTLAIDDGTSTDGP